MHVEHHHVDLIGAKNKHRRGDSSIERLLVQTVVLSSYHTCVSRILSPISSQLCGSPSNSPCGPLQCSLDGRTCLRCRRTNGLPSRDPEHNLPPQRDGKNAPHEIKSTVLKMRPVSCKYRLRSPVRTAPPSLCAYVQSMASVTISPLRAVVRSSLNKLHTTFLRTSSQVSCAMPYRVKVYLRHQAASRGGHAPRDTAAPAGNWSAGKAGRQGT